MYIMCTFVHVLHIQGCSRDPLTVVVEDWEESQTPGGEEAMAEESQGGEESMAVDLSLSEPVDEPASRRQFERHLAVVCICVCVCVCVSDAEHIITVGHRPYSGRSADMAVH